MEQSELNIILEEHAKWLKDDSTGKRANLSEANLRYANLSGADLRYANLTEANLTDANLTYANLSRADLRYANLREANLTDANLSGADLRYINLREANLSGANLREADLSEANLSGANLREADLSEADLTYTGLSEADLSEADLIGADLRGAIGNDREIRTLLTEFYHVTYTSDQMAIGCEQHAITDWFKFDDKRIEAMDEHATEFWTLYKPILITLININKKDQLED